MDWLSPFLLAVVLLAGFGIVWWRRRQHTQALLSSVEVVTVPDFYSHHLDNARPLTIFLPPHYHHTDQSYKLLFINDGQDAEALHLRQTLATLYARRQIEPLVVVAIPTNEERLEEYGTAVAANRRGLGSKAALYARFVTNELLPVIRQTFRVSERAVDTAVLGASLGGLSAFDLAWNFPDDFGIVGVMSGSFWWTAADDETNIEPGERIAHSLVRQGPKREGQRFWFEAATQDEVEDRDQNGVIDAIQDTLELIDELEKMGYRRGKDLVYVEMPGGRHNYDTWAQVLPQFLRWAFPA
ncbi:MAG TPA: alpha/beta hydrolase-fold protein [Chloroflexota bacterium]|nr:alpha/beta hydrolase-fold protein [Chloroflexota bacterium]